MKNERMLNIDEACEYLSITKNYMYKLVARRAIPHYKPLGKLLYFAVEDLDNFIQSVRISSDAEMNAKVQAYMF